jgi:N-dimethylarginine dimethylaminohydrolase
VPTPFYRVAEQKRYLMCPPTYFDVRYSINPWMDPTKPTDQKLAMAQWERLRDIYVGLGHTVELIDPLPELPDMVFAANGATVVDGRVLCARFRNAERAEEGPAYAAWFRANRFAEVHDPVHVNEGEGDYLVTGQCVLGGSGFRTGQSAHAEAAAVFRRPVVGLTLVDPSFYHLDTALAVLTNDEIMYYPAAFDAASRRTLHTLFPNAIRASRQDADVFGLNAASDGRHVVLPHTATGLICQLRARGFEPIGVDLSELLKAGGGAKCCTLELRPVTHRSAPPVRRTAA